VPSLFPGLSVDEHLILARQEDGGRVTLPEAYARLERGLDGRLFGGSGSPPRLSRNGLTMLLSVRKLVGGYKAIRIVNGVSFKLGTSETLALLGRNGVGKTTLLRTLAGLADRFAGEVLIDGIPISRAAVASRPARSPAVSNSSSRSAARWRPDRAC
jgi:ABC-type multidrug transport system fused ATPase/permease subunit